ncbi:MAG: hypothetical protein R3F30_09960 [Planctomycetota bacterium]
MRPLSEHRERYPLPEPELLALALALADRLAEEHALDRVHGGVRVEVVAWDGAARCELGPGPVADAGDHGDPGARERLAYLSPEQCHGAAPTLRSDMYSLGAVLFEAAAGVVPHEDDDLAALLEDRRAGRPPGLGELPPVLSLEWEALLAICLADEPKERFASALDLLAELRQLERRGGRQRLLRRPHWPRILVAAAALVALVLALWALL